MSTTTYECFDGYTKYANSTWTPVSGTWTSLGAVTASDLTTAYSKCMDSSANGGLGGETLKTTTTSSNGAQQVAYTNKSIYTCYDYYGCSNTDLTKAYNGKIATQPGTDAVTSSVCEKSANALSMSTQTFNTSTGTLNAATCQNYFSKGVCWTDYSAAGTNLGNTVTSSDCWTLGGKSFVSQTMSTTTTTKDSVTNKPTLYCYSGFDATGTNLGTFVDSTGRLCTAFKTGMTTTTYATSTTSGSTSISGGSSTSVGGMNTTTVYGQEGCSYKMDADGKVYNNTADCGTCYADKTCTTALSGTYHRNACFASTSGLGFKNGTASPTCVAKPHLDDEVQVAEEAEYEAELEILEAEAALLADAGKTFAEADFADSE